MGCVYLDSYQQYILLETDHKDRLAAGGIDSEINFFRYIRPIVGIEAPVGLHARFDPVSYNSIVVLVDMSDTVDFLEYYSPVTHEMVCL